MVPISPRFLRLALACALLPRFVAAAPLSDAETQALLAKLAEKGQRPVAADFRETRTLPLLEQPVVEEGIIEFAPPAFLRKEVLRPRPSLAISDGDTLWLIFPARGEAERYALGKHRQLREAIGAVLAAFQPAGLGRTFQIAGRRSGDATLLTLTPLDRDLRRSVEKIETTFRRDLSVAEIRVDATDGGRTVLQIGRERAVPFDRGRFKPPEGIRETRPPGF